VLGYENLADCSSDWNQSQNDLKRSRVDRSSVDLRILDSKVCLVRDRLKSMKATLGHLDSEGLEYGKQEVRLLR
jgi:hypothetical protein